MTAKEYLQQLKVLDRKIDQRLRESEQLRSLVQGRGMRTDSERVQTSPTNAQENIIINYLDIEAEIDKTIDEYILKKDKVISQIHSITGTNAEKYIQILFDHYVPDEKHHTKSLEQISVEMHFNYDYIRHLHGLALEKFASVAHLK